MCFTGHPSGRVLPQYPENSGFTSKYVMAAPQVTRELTLIDARKLTSEFGIIFLDSDYSIKTRQEYFYTSPAWDGLRTWVCSHPRLASQANDDYLIGWRHRMAIELAIAAGSY